MRSPGEVDFWGLLASVPPADRVGHRMAERLATVLARLPIPRIAKFHAILLERCYDALTWELWEAAEVIHRNHLSQDSFLYFRLWVVSRGRHTFNTAVTNPDSLAGEPWIRRLAGLPPSTPWANADFPSLEELMYAPEMAYDLVLAKLPAAVAKDVEKPDVLDRRPQEIADPNFPVDFGSASRIARRYPRLAASFPPRAGLRTP